MKVGTRTRLWTGVARLKQLVKSSSLARSSFCGNSALLAYFEKTRYCISSEQHRSGAALGHTCMRPIAAGM